MLNQTGQPIYQWLTVAVKQISRIVAVDLVWNKRRTTDEAWDWIKRLHHDQHKMAAMHTLHGNVTNFMTRIKSRPLEIFSCPSRRTLRLGTIQHTTWPLSDVRAMPTVCRSPYSLVISGQRVRDQCGHGQWRQ